MIGLVLSLVGGLILSAATNMPMFVIGAPVLYTVVNVIDLATTSRVHVGPKLTYASPLVTIFAQDIQQALFPDNTFYKNSIDDSMWVKGAKVNLPQAGAPPNVVVNRSSYPLTAAKRTDTSEEYDLAELSTDAIHLQYTEGLQVNYNKRMSIWSQSVDQLNTKFAALMASIWMPAGSTNQVRTTGAARVGSAPGATGNRKRIAKEDLIEANRLLNRMDVPTDGRCLLINADMYADMLAIPEFTDASKFGSPESALVQGFIGYVLGFKVYMRSVTHSYDNTGTPVKKAFGAATATTDNAAALAWHPRFVRRAEGKVVPFVNEADALMQGDVYSFLINAGGRIARTNQEGVVSIIETATA